MTVGRLWAGEIYGTNTGNIFLKLEGPETALSGTLRVNESKVGLIVYTVTGSYNASTLILHGQPLTQVEGYTFGPIIAQATLNKKGQLEGEWESGTGCAGTFLLFPHDASLDIREAEDVPEQIHAARHQLGAIEIDLPQVIGLAEDIQRDFKRPVVVTLMTSTEQTWLLPDFKKLQFSNGKGLFLKLYVSEPEYKGLNRTIIIEFGQQIDIVTVQGTDEARVLGTLEKLKSKLRPFERAYITNFKKFGIGIDQLLFIGAIITLPSIDRFPDRGILMFSVLTLIWSIKWLHHRLLPLTVVHLGKRPQGLWSKLYPTILSWFIAASAGTAATLLAAHLTN